MPNFKIPVRALSLTGKKIVKVWSAVMAVAAVVAAGVVVEARVEVAMVVVVTTAVVLVSPLSLYRSSATVPFHFVLKLLFPENKKNLNNSRYGNYWSESILVFTRRCRII